jgi:hypothetical protein
MESSKMADIYEISVINISAAFGSSPQNGILHDREHWRDMRSLNGLYNPFDSTQADVVSLRAHLYDDVETEISIRRASPHEYMLVTGNDDGSPLYQRGWVFQETC